MSTLDVLPNLLSVLAKNDRVLTQALAQRSSGAIRVSSLHCPTCGGLRKVLLRTLWRDTEGFLNLAGDIAAQLTPSLHQMTCGECDTRFTALIFEGTQGSELAIFANKAGGLATKNTPPEVAYYLDQAWRCQAVGANTAAVAMFRAALEQLLLKEGYAERTLADSINKLEKDATEGKGREWLRSTSASLLRAMKDLGNGAVHTNEGDITKQAAFNSGLLAMYNAVMRGLLEAVYERGQRDKEIQAELEAAAKSFKKSK